MNSSHKFMQVYAANHSNQLAVRCSSSHLNQKKSVINISIAAGTDQTCMRQLTVPSLVVALI